MNADIVADIRYAVRRLGRERAFSTAAVLCLALGIGANTAMFTVVNGVLLRQLPLSEPERVVHIWQTWNPKAWHDEQISAGELRDYQAKARSVEAVAGYLTGGTSLANADRAYRVQMALVTPEFFDVAGVRPALGRSFTAEEASVPGAVFAVLSDGLWNSAFARDAGIVGRQVTMGGRKVTILGVMPHGFDFPQGAALWRPLVLSPADIQNRSQHFINAVARARRGTSIAAVSAEFNALALQMPTNKPGGARALAALDQLVGPIRGALWLLLAAVGIVLLIACGNVANLFLTRAVSRRRELALRSAMGASAGRIVRQLLTESVVLSAAGALLGLGISAVVVRLVIVGGPTSLPRLSDIQLDLRVLVFTAVLGVLTGVVFGLAPAISAAKLDLAAALREVRSLAARGQRRLRATLVVAEIALSLVLLVGGSLVVQSLARLRMVDPGFRSDNVLTARIALPGATYPRADHRREFFNEVLRRVRVLPGVRSAGAVSLLPISAENVSSSAVKEGPIDRRGGWPEANVRSVTSGYLESLGIPLLAGRSFTEAEGGDSTAAKTALINQAMADQLWPGENPIGKRFSIFSPPDRPDFREVIGVVGNVRQSRLDAPPRIEAYEPFRRTADGSMTLVIRTAGNPRSVASSVREIVTAVDKTIPVYDVRTMDEQVARSIAARRFNALILGGFSVLALILASIGLYGVIAHSVSQRTGEIGVRMALGARTRDIHGLVIGEGMRLALFGIAIGAGGAALSTRLLTGLLFGVPPRDVTTFLACALALAAVAFAASYLPARRATRVDPLTALRSD